MCHCEDGEPKAKQDEAIFLPRHCEERSDEAISEIATLLPSVVARNDVSFVSLRGCVSTRSNLRSANTFPDKRDCFASLAMTKRGLAMTKRGLAMTKRGLEMTNEELSRDDKKESQARNERKRQLFPC